MALNYFPMAAKPLSETKSKANQCLRNRKAATGFLMCRKKRAYCESFLFIEILFACQQKMG